MVTAIQFLNPEYLWMLCGIPAVAIVLYYSLSMKRGTLLLFQGGIHFIKAIRFRNVIPALLILSVLILAMTRPSSGYEDVSIPAVRSDLLFVVDVSQSMRADDVQPSRLTLAKRKIFDTLDILTTRKDGVRVGILLFAGSAYVYCPLTEDYSVVRIFAESINTSLISDPGSNLIGALRLATNTLQTIGSKDPRIVVLSDGEDSSPNKEAQLETIETLGYPVDTLAFGTAEGGPIKLASGRFLRSADGNFVVSRVHTALLQKIAAQTGGIYQSAANQPTDIQAIVDAITLHRSSTGLQKTEEKVRIYREIGPYLVLSTFALICFFLLARYPTILFILALQLIVPQYKAVADTTDLLPSETAQRASRAYRSGDYESATTLYREALRAAPDNTSLLAGLAASLYKTENYKEASELYAKIEENATSGRVQFEALYNEGTAHLLATNPEKAITAYEKALTIKPDDQHTRDNLAIARLLKQQMENKTNPDPKQNDSTDSKEQESEQQKASDTKSSESDKNDTQDKEQKSDTTSEQEEDTANTESPNRDKPEDQQSSEKQKDPAKSESSEQTEEEPSSETQPESNTESLDSVDPADKKNAPDEPEPDNPFSDERETHSKKELSKTDAAKWLDSLPDSPVLLRQKGGQHTGGEQTW